MTPRKVGVVLKRMRDLNKMSWGWRLAWRGSTEKTFAQIERKTPVFRPGLQAN